jgi:hypothetical protein
MTIISLTDLLAVVDQKENNTFTALSEYCRPSSIYSITVLVDSQRPCFLIDVIEAPIRAASVAKPRLNEWAEYCSECNNPDTFAGTVARI